jgi:hypothetical protein
MRMNQKGVELGNKWWNIYCQENDRLGGDSAELDFVEGTRIVDNERYIKTIEDICGYLLLCYDNCAIDCMEDWFYGCDDNYTIYGFTYSEIKAELEKYYTIED